MATYKIYALGASNITVSGGASLSGYTQGSGAQLAGKTITLNSSNWVGINIKDNEQYFADGDNSQALDGAQSFDGTTYASGRMVEAEYRVTVQAPDGQTYELVGFNIKEPNSAYQAYGTIEGLAFIGKFPPVGVPLKVIATAEGPGASSTLSSSYAVPCFVAGTVVDTCDGPRAVESLAAGDRVWTLDDGLQPLRQILITRVDAFRMQSDKRLWPVQIRAGAFGPDCPSRDVMVSPQHKILIDDWRASYF